MWLALPSPAVAAEILVGPGESIASALSDARDGDVVLVDAAADPSGRVNLSDLSLTVRAATDTPPELPFLNLSGVDLTLQNVRIEVEDLGPQTRGITAFDSRIVGDDVAFLPTATTEPMVGIYLVGGAVELTRVTARGLDGWLVIAEDSGGDAEITLRDCELTNIGAPRSGTSGVVQLPGGTATKNLTIEGCRFTDNAAVSPLITVAAPGTLVIRDTVFADNASPGAAPSAVSATGTPLTLDHARFCGNGGPAVVALVGADATVTRTLFDGAGLGAGEVPFYADEADVTIHHATFIGDPSVSAIAVGRSLTLVNTLFAGFDEAMVLAPAALDARHTLWIGDEPAWLTGSTALIVAEDAGFVDDYTRAGCDDLPVPGETSPAIDAGDPAFPLEDGDVGLPDVGAYPGVAAAVDVPPGGFIVGGGGCTGAPATVGSAAWLVAGLLSWGSRRSRSGTTS